MIFREWQKRRVIITKDIISFAFADANDENQIDYIPFAEVEFVKEMEADITGDMRKNHEDRHRITISTEPNGYNSGRAYYLALNSKEELDRLTAKMTKLSNAARVRAQAKTVFRLVQLKVRNRYESNVVQGFMALMIGAVRCVSISISISISTSMSI